MMTPEMFGARGDAVRVSPTTYAGTDDTEAIQLMFDASLNGQECIFSNKNYLVTYRGTGDYCLRVTVPVRINGPRGFHSNPTIIGAGTTHYNGIVFDQRVPPWADIIQYEPINGNVSYGFTVDGLNITPSNYTGDPSVFLSSSFYGRDGIRIITDEVAQSAHMYDIRFCRIWATSGHSIQFSGIDAGNNAVAGVIEHNDLWSGIKFDNAGDSNNILYNMLGGRNWGIEFEGQNENPNETLIIGNNITSRSGALKVHKGSRLKFRDNNCEQLLPCSGSGYLVDLESDLGNSGDIEISGNLLSSATPAGTDTLSALVRVGSSAFSTKIFDNSFMLYPSAVGKCWGIVIDQSSRLQYTRVGANDFAGGGSFAGYCLDNNPTPTFSTIGMPGARDISSLLANNWQHHPAGESPNIYRDETGVIHLSGFIRGGTVSSGTNIIAGLPQHLSPRIPKYDSVTTAYGIARVLIVGGFVILQGPAPDNVWLNLNLTWMAPDGNAIPQPYA